MNEKLLTWVRAQLTVARALELGASVFTLAGMFAGSTTTFGVLLYFVGTAWWFALSIQSKQWGLMPMNFGALFVLVHNLRGLA